MIENQKQKKAIQAIQDLIVKARNFSCQNMSYERLAEFLDDLEYLPSLIVEDKDNTTLFEDYLRDICDRNCCMDVFIRYEKR